MEWVETTGRTIEDAKEAALDELGVDEQDAEFEVLEEPKLGLFGRLRNEGRVRARVRPVAPPAKDERRRRGRNGSRSTATGSASATDGAPSTGDAVDEPSPSPAPRARSRSAKGDGSGSGTGGGRGARTKSDADADPVDAPADQQAASTGGPKRNPQRVNAPAAERSERPAPTGNGAARSSGRRSSSNKTGQGSTRGEGNEVEVSLAEQSQVAEEFLRGLIGEFGVTADIVSAQPDEDTLDLALTGADLGMLIGPKGATLLALQDLTRTIVQRKTGASNGRIHVDVGGYRQKRSEALSRFANQVAEQVKTSGERKALEPMSAPDRKVVHDALTDFDGVTTASEGEDAQRRVVILPVT